MVQKLIFGLWYFLPVLIANMAPVFATLFFSKIFSTPIDFNKKFCGQPLFGKTKTYRGFAVAVFTGILVAFLQTRLYNLPYLSSISLINYSSINFVLWGFLMGFGALFGDLIKSFFKRRLNIKSSKMWIPFDQLDFILGSILFTFPLYTPPLDIILVVLVFMPFIALGVSYLGYFFKIRPDFSKII